MKLLRASLMCLCAAAFIAAAPPTVLVPFNAERDVKLGDVYVTWSGTVDSAEAQLSIHRNEPAADWTKKSRLDELTSIAHLRLPAGDYTLRFTAAGYKPVTLRAKVGGVRTNVEFPLRRFPRVTGVVMRGTSPLAGATIATDAGDLAKSDAVGRFSLSVEHEWRTELRVNYPGLATKLITLPAAEADVNAGNITLTPGGTLVANIQLPDG